MAGWMRLVLVCLLCLALAVALALLFEAGGS